MSAGFAIALLGIAALLAPARGPDRRDAAGTQDGDLPLVLDLAAAGLRSGRPLADALTLAAPAGSASDAALLDRVATLSRLGADPEHAWSGVPRDGPLGQVAGVALRSSSSGLKLASGMERLAGDLRAERATAAAVRAHRAGVLAMAPLAACFLPSFVCLGIVPVVVGVARDAFSVFR